MTPNIDKITRIVKRAMRIASDGPVAAIPPCQGVDAWTFVPAQKTWSDCPCIGVYNLDGAKQLAVDIRDWMRER